VTKESERREIEVKLPSSDLDAVRQKLRGQGASLERERHDESNDLYDDPAGRLSASGAALRLRRVPGEARLTYKGPARFEQGVKAREERETAVADGGEAAAILESLGFQRKFRYEKRREEWRLSDCAVCLDETPIGDFVEIEGDPAAIRRVVSELELDFASAIPYSYPRLYALQRERNASLPPDMVWAPASSGRERTSGG